MSTTSTTKTLADILFAFKAAPISICPGQSTNTACPAATPRSPKRGSARTSNPPRFSKLASELEKVLTGKTAALWSKDGSKLYCEIISSSGEVEPFLYDSSTKNIYATNYVHASIPMLLWAMHEKSEKFDYTRTAAQQLVTNMDTAAITVTATDLGFLCECFYYDFVDELSALGSTLQVSAFDTDVSNSVQQAIRTNSFEQITQPFGRFMNQSFSAVSYTPTKTSSTESSKSVDDVFAEAKDGAYRIAYEWTAEQEEKIRPLSSLDDYIPNDTYRKITKVASKRLNRVLDRVNRGVDGLDAIRDDYVNVIIGGRPGTGKTTTADALSATLGLPIYTAKVTRNTEEDTFEGMTKADGDGKFKVHDTAFLKAFEHGGIVVLEEFNLADPGVMQGAIGQAIEYPFILNKDGYMEIRRHPMCIIIATMNTGTQGAREPNQALTSRFPITLTMNDPTEYEFLQILEKHGHKKMLCKKVYKAYTAVLNYLKTTANDEEMTLCVTMRHCLAALEMVDDGISDTVRDAIYDTMIGSIGLRDASLAEDVFERAIKPLGGLD